MLSSTILLMFVLGYSCGSIPFGVLCTRLSSGLDPRAFGSGNIGTTNVIRTAGLRTGLTTFVFDVLKAALPAYIVKTNYGVEAGFITGSGVIIGHIFPIWLKFSGGKGVATFFGFLLAADIYSSIIMFFCWLFAFHMTKISSIASILAILCVIIYNIANAMFTPSHMSQYNILLCATLILIKHKSNIIRIINGTEKKLEI